jgi:hypothetical protein
MQKIYTLTCKQRKKIKKVKYLSKKIGYLKVL